MRLDLDLAERMTHAACAAAAGAGCLVSAAVVDAGGHLVAFRRMDGAEFAGATVAVDKAYTAAGNRIATMDLRDQVAPGGDLAVRVVNDLGEDAYATPAFADGRIYVRTTAALYAFGTNGA